jgi:hypothetical protein
MRILKETGSRSRDTLRFFSRSGREKMEYDLESIEIVVLVLKLFCTGGFLIENMITLP